jgi:hypothetical protein
VPRGAWEPRVRLGQNVIDDGIVVAFGALKGAGNEALNVRGLNDAFIVCSGEKQSVEPRKIQCGSLNVGVLGIDHRLQQGKILSHSALATCISLSEA